ncbi:MAG: DUF5695 domain-containing protein [Verrucomicrobiota bacterium]|nr:DUF5695 domain-containing protein [Limisphaera sp.]MDW8382779.1 DUF5695 domain-containing protein [Verrucomicrobiota bacterium]
MSINRSYVVISDTGRTADCSLSKRAATSGRELLLSLVMLLLMADFSLPGQSASTQGASLSSGSASTNAPGPNRRGRNRIWDQPATLGLEQGWIDFQTPDFEVRLVKAAQTLGSLRAKPAGFDFVPLDQLEFRSRDGFYHIGDLTVRLKRKGETQWSAYSTAQARRPVLTLPVQPPELAAADLSPTLPEEIPLAIRRVWLVRDGRLVLRFELRNRSQQPVEIGSLGFALVFNNLIHDFITDRARSLQETHEKCVFFDPYIGQGAGYLQVTRLNGQGPALLVLPEGQTAFEAWRRLPEPVNPMQTFEGVFEWMVHSRAWAEQEWSNTVPWNVPTARLLAPGETCTYGLQFVTAPSIRELERTLAASGRPVVVGVPGYILPQDLEGSLFVRYGYPVERFEVDPPGGLQIVEQNAPGAAWKSYRVLGRSWGRVRLTLHYADGLQQTVHYYVIKPMVDAVADLGRFLFTRQWFEDPKDPFGRSPSIMSYDRETDRIVTQDSRVWIAGLSDEGGAGSWIAAACKLWAQPEPAQVKQFERFVHEVLWGRLQYSEGDLKFGVRKSLFYYTTNEISGFQYDPALNWRTWTSWPEHEARSVGRGYNYPHVVIAYWSLYRLARLHPGLVTSRPWEWFLNQAWETTMFMTSRTSEGRPRVGYVNWGLMQGSIFVELLRDLQREGWIQQAEALQARMKERADRWARQPYPFGSEMAWDSTGQEEVYTWCKHFGYEDPARTTIEAILGYMPTLPHWGYNGCARRYWDFLYAGKIRRIERQLHHYGSGLNAIPLLNAYRENPSDLYLLRVGYGGSMGALANIDPEGFASAAFHSYPDTLRWDPYSGDYGPNFFGHVMTSGTYVLEHPEWGWLAFGGHVRAIPGRIRVEPRDSLRRRLYMAPLQLWLTLDVGRFEAFEAEPERGRIRVGLAPADPFTPVALLRVEHPGRPAMRASFQPVVAFPTERGAYKIPLTNQVSWVELIER